MQEQLTLEHLVDNAGQLRQRSATHYADMKFMYFSHQTLQIPRVARQCMVALCEAAGHLGAHAEIVSFRTALGPHEPQYPPFRELYGVTAPLTSTSYRILGTDPDNSDRNLFGGVQRFVVYLWRILRFVIGSEHKQYRSVVCSARNYSILALLLFARKFCRNMVVLADVHGVPSGKLARRVLRRVDGSVCISQTLADTLRVRFGLEQSRVMVAHSGVKTERFEMNDVSRESLRRNLELPTDKRIVCYAGKVFYRYEEVAYMIEAAQSFPDDILMVIVGGRPDQVVMWEKECEEQGARNVLFRSFVPPSEIPLYLRAADLLTMYYSPNLLNEYRSPGKLFEYLASGTPIVASRMKSVEEVITDRINGFLVEPYKPELLGKTIVRILSGSEDLEQLSAQAIQTAHSYTWKERAKRFLQTGWGKL